MELATHSTKVWRRKVGQDQRQWTQCLLPLRSVTGAMPAYFWKADGVGEALALLAEGGEQAARRRRPGAGQMRRRVGSRGAARSARDLLVEARDAGRDGAELRRGAPRRGGEPAR